MSDPLDIENPMNLIKRLQPRTENIRNICVIAHVDHGKTSLVDSLISYNNIINPRLAGDLRYMDSRPDEQERCITMKSSSISISYQSEINNDEYLINLIDSPGHVDFSSEIFSALKICDGAIVVIDVVEGICSQTESVIKQAWDENIKCVLVLNKIDRLITEVQMGPMEAYLHLNNILEKANSLMGSLIVRDITVKTNLAKQDENQSEKENDEGEIDIDKLIEEKENELYFSPDRGNVIFTSAIDNWGFNLSTFSQILSKKLGFRKEAFQKVLWGDYYFSTKNKKVYTDPEKANKYKPIFVEFVLENIYKLYKLILIEKSAEKVAKAIQSINIEVNQKELNNIEKNPRALLKSIFRQWLPIPNAVLDVVVSHLPNPVKGCANKIDIMFPPYKLSQHEYPMVSNLKNIINEGKLKHIDLNNKELPCIAFISKMVPISRKNISGEKFTYDSNQENGLNSKDEVKYMAFARNYCGTIKKGHEYFVIGPKHDPKSNKYDIYKFKFDKLYFFMGQYLEEIDEVPPGNIFSVGGLENFVYKTATISSVFECPAIIPNNINKNSIIKVSISAEDVKEMGRLVEGLKKLNKSDPAVDYYVQENGEHILVTSGEVHLERCLKDLEDHLAKVKFRTSPPIVNFKEGLSNVNFTYRKNKLEKECESKVKKQLKQVVVKEKERKKELNKGYVLDEGEHNQDLDNQAELMKSCTPMILMKEPKQAKPDEKVAKHKIKDIKSIKEKTNDYIQKNQGNLDENEVSSKLKGYAEDITPNKLLQIGVIALGMTPEMIKLIDKNETILMELSTRNYTVDKTSYEALMKFKEELLQLIDNKRLRQLIENNLYSFGLSNSLQNMLVIKNISKKNCFFDRIKIEGEANPEEMCEDEIINQELEDSRSISCKGESSISNKESKASIKSKNSKNISIKNKKLNEKGEETSSINTNIKPIAIEDEIQINFKNMITPNEFVNAVRSGFELAISNGPICEENMYGVIFIIEEIKISKEEKNKDEIKEKSDNISQVLRNEPSTIYDNSLKKDVIDGDVEINSDKDKDSDFTIPSIPHEINNNLEKEQLLTNEKVLAINQSDSLMNNKNVLDIIQSNLTKKEEIVLEDNSISSYKFGIYGPFMGQIIGTVKDCCRRAFLNGDPRLFEALYLCTFQIKQENVGKVHSVLNKRRGMIINESSNDESIFCTIEAVIPVAESFGFVEEIRKKSSGMANPMLQFYKWEMIDIDPFYLPIDQDVIDNFGVNIDTPNLAKNYVNKIRLRKGLPIDEKIVKDSDKQKNLSKKR